MTNDHIRYWADLINENLEETVGGPMDDNPDPGLHTCVRCDLDFTGPSKNGLCPKCAKEHAKKFSEGGNEFELGQEVVYNGKTYKIVDMYNNDDTTWLYSLDEIGGDEQLSDIPEVEIELG